MPIEESAGKARDISLNHKVLNYRRAVKLLALAVLYLAATGRLTDAQKVSLEEFARGR